MIINVHAGHNPDGKKACGAVGLIKESTKARKVKNEVIRLLKSAGHTVYDCTVSNGTSQNDVLKKIVKKCNAHKVDLDVSIHFNSGRNDYSGDGSTGGVEVWIHDAGSKAAEEAERVCAKVSSLGFRNRGVKTSSSLYVLKNTKAPAMLVECCFVDDADDVKLFKTKKMARAIVEGILDHSIVAASTAPEQKKPEKSTAIIGTFKVKVTDDELNIRKGPGMEHGIIGCIRDKGTYTITETSGSWGKLKSGAGWISISTKYVKYL